MGCLAGMISKNASTPDPDAFLAMMKSLEHRCETKPTIVVGDRYRIGYARTLMEAGTQSDATMWHGFDHWCVDGTVLLPDGKPYAFPTPDDLANDRLESLREMTGTFVVLLVDRAHEYAYLVLDHYGINSLLWAESDSYLYFASEIKAINAAGFPREPHPGGTMEFLFHGLPLADRTMQKGIRYLMPGSVMRVSLKDGSQSSQTYYAPEMQVRADRYSMLSRSSENALITELENLLEESVSHSLPRTGKVGVFLSGGVDSSTLTAVAAKRRPDILACTVDVTEPPGISEVSYARRAAKHIGVTLEAVSFGGRAFRENLVKTIFCMETPLIVENAVALLVAAERMGSRDVKLILDGEGADSLFGIISDSIRWKLFRSRLRNLGGALGIGPRLDALVKKILKGTARFGARVSIPGEGHQGLHFLLNAGGFTWADEMARLQKLFDHIPDPIEREIQTDLLNEFYCYSRPFYQRLARTCALNAIELRLPINDASLIEFGVNLPLKHKMRYGRLNIRPTVKYLWKKLAARHLPTSLLYRPKMGFGIPGGLFVGQLPPEWFSQGYLVSEYDLPEDFVRKWYYASEGNRDRFFFATLEIWGQIFIQGRTWQEVEGEYLSANQ